MSTKFQSLRTAIALLSTGCAAPMTEVVATRQSETIDQNLFKEGDEVWIAYQDSMDTVKTKRGFVLDTDDDSVRLIEYRQAFSYVVKDRWDVGQERSIDIEYRQVHMLSHPVKDRWFVGLSGGTFYTSLPVPQELPRHEPLSAIGISSRYSPYSNQAFEANFSVGRGKIQPLKPWLGMTLNMHMYFMSHAYFLLGTGWEWSDLSEWFDIRDYDGGKLHHHPIFRWGLGVAAPIPRTKFDARIEAEVGVIYGLRTYFEYRLQE